MRPNVLILGGTTEGTALAAALAGGGIAGTVSLAGRVANPRAQALPQRVGGFGGVAGLADWLRAHRVTHVVDATHPFAAQMHRHAVLACADADVPLIALSRPPWRQTPEDRWIRVPDMAAAAAALDGPARRVMLAVGRMHLADFAGNPQHFYLLRLVDPPQGALPFPRVHVVVDRGPFDAAADTALLRDRAIDLIVSKNAGGTGAFAKIEAARRLRLPVVMIDRPATPDRAETAQVQGVLDWLHAGTDRGV
ncbi:hypothetical protein OCGS_0475 [Oceaniovalibus guishaninsula JLT2003]|uniref:Precorrin-6x reductase n=1 Tax=Oceaniovalibus guishaninsula JLT2003 TaxID=1231392 RepID=K2I8L1_9RHOB|nr:cobalt-precorrin-6A reductase [Oceaniovalibus guishaninsula]EKE45385.1 hypothetical protein OCGS_0475 [Oceaniovalibus guishaninsula JLT2003]